MTTEPVAPADSVDPEVDKVVASVRRRLPGDVPDGAISEAVRAGFSAYADARVRQFVPMLAERSAVAHLSGRTRAS